MFTRIMENCTKQSRYQIGAWQITLRTAGTVPHPRIQFPSCLAGDRPGEPVKLTLWHQPPGPETAAFFQSLWAEADPVCPFGLGQFYRGLEEAGIRHLPFGQHCNRYAARGDDVLMDFPFPSDQFRIVLRRSGGHVFLFGPEDSIGRVLHDVCCVAAAYLPVHGSAAERNGQAVCFLGDSGSGKTFALMNLLQHGYRYLADDELFVHAGAVYSVSGHIQLRCRDQAEKENTSTHTLHVPTGEKGVPVRSYLLRSPHGPELIQLFPCVARQSFWWLSALSPAQIRAMDIPGRVLSSKRRAQTLLESCTAAAVDFHRVRQRSDTPDPEKSFLIL